MNTKVFTALFGFSALLAGGVVGAGVAAAVSTREKSQAQPTPVTRTTPSASSSAGDEHKDKALISAADKMSHLKDLTDRINQCFQSEDAAPAKLYAYLSQLPAADLEAIVESNDTGDRYGSPLFIPARSGSGNPVCQDDACFT